MILARTKYTSLKYFTHKVLIFTIHKNEPTFFARVSLSSELRLNFALLSKLATIMYRRVDLNLKILFHYTIRHELVTKIIYIVTLMKLKKKKRLKKLRR